MSHRTSYRHRIIPIHEAPPISQFRGVRTRRRTNTAAARRPEEADAYLSPELGLNQTDTFTSNRYAVKPNRPRGPDSENPKEGQMVVKEKVSGPRSEEKRRRCQRLDFPETRYLRPDTWFFQSLNLPLQARIARHNRSEINDVDDPGDSVGCEEVSVSFHRALPRGSNSDCRAWAWSTSRCSFSSR